MKGKKSLTNGLIILLGLLSLVPLAGPLLNLLKSGNLRKKMNTTNENGWTIYDLLLNAGFNEKFARWITAQSAHETGNFSSNIFKNNYNAFGIKYAGQATALGEKNGYAYYNNLEESVRDYKRLYKSYGIILVDTIEGFIIILKNKGYFEAPIENYLAGVKHFLKLYFK
jgi:hypothetical protein